MIIPLSSQLYTHQLYPLAMVSQVRQKHSSRPVLPVSGGSARANLAAWRVILHVFRKKNIKNNTRWISFYPSSWEIQTQLMIFLKKIKRSINMQSQCSPIQSKIPLGMIFNILKNYFTSCDPHRDFFTFSEWQIFWHSI